METFTTRHRDPDPLSVIRLDAAGSQAAFSEAQRILASDALSPLDAVIHGVRVRLHTNSTHWHRFWSANWFTPGQWGALTGSAPPDEAKFLVYATRTDSSESPWAGYNPAKFTAFLSGDVSYGPLRALAVDAVTHWLAEEEGVHFVPGLCMKRGREIILLLDTPGVDRTIAVPALMNRSDTHLVAFGGVSVRYGLVRMVDGVTMLPTQVIDEQGVTTRGYRIFPWLDDNGFSEPRADVRCLTLDGKREYCFARDLDLGRVPDAMAYAVEKAWYLPTQLVGGTPELVGALWPRSESETALLENVPPFTPEVSQRLGPWASTAAAAPPVKSLVEALGEAKVIEALCRLRAAPEARAIVPPQLLWPGRAGWNPWQPLRIRGVALLANDELIALDSAALKEHLAGECVRRTGLYGEEANKILTTELAQAISATS